MSRGRRRHERQDKREWGANLVHSIYIQWMRTVIDGKLKYQSIEEESDSNNIPVWMGFGELKVAIVVHLPRLKFKYFTFR